MNIEKQILMLLWCAMEETLLRGIFYAICSNFHKIKGKRRVLFDDYMTHALVDWNFYKNQQNLSHKVVHHAHYSISEWAHKTYILAGLWFFCILWFLILLNTPLSTAGTQFYVRPYTMRNIRKNSSWNGRNESDSVWRS